MNTTKNKAFWWTFGISLFTYLSLVCWVASIGPYICDCIMGICSFVLTWICLDKFRVKEQIQYKLICSGVILGQSILILLIIALTLGKTIIPIYEVATSIVSSCLAAICYKEKKVTTIVLSLIIFVLMVTYVQEAFIQFLGHKTNIIKE